MFICLISFPNFCYTGNEIVVEKEYYPDGKIKSETPYKDGKKDGIEKTYNASGHLFSEIPFKDGVRVGTARLYYDNGKVMSEVEWKNDKIVGEAKLYDENGSLVKMEAKKPGFKLTSPIDGATVSGIVNFDIASDNEEDFQPYHLYVKGDKGGALIGTDKRKPFSISWDSRYWPNGIYTITVTGGLENGVQHISVNVQNDSVIMPSVSITSPKDGETISGKMIIKVDATPDDAFKYILCTVGNLRQKAYYSWPFEISINTSTMLRNGTYKIRAVGRLKSAIKDVVDAVTVHVDN